VAYETRFFGDNKEVKHHKGHQKVASAKLPLSLLAPLKCHIHATAIDRTAVILRVVQNQRMQGGDISKLQNVVDGDFWA
jgi:hypothetical protein